MKTKPVNNKKQNEIAQNHLRGSDLAQREQDVLKDAAKLTGFTPTKLIGRSAWWGSSEIGAFHYLGNYNGKKAVLKIQGVKPSTSEIYMINFFAKTNKSRVIRPPYLYASLAWDDERRYEALVLEFIEGQKVVQTPTTDSQVDKFFQIYEDYRNNCLKSPWVDRPDETIVKKIQESFKSWRESSLKIYPNHPLRKEGDGKLLDEAIEVLVKGYQDVEPEFMHGHFSEADLYEVDGQIVVLSNLYWSWRQPYYDAIFAYHWFIYHLNTIEGITPEVVEKQRSLWLNKIEALPKMRGGDNKLLDLALLERAAAGLNLDALSCDPQKPITRYLVQATRERVKDLIGKSR